MLHYAKSHRRAGLPHEALCGHVVECREIGGYGRRRVDCPQCLGVEQRMVAEPQFVHMLPARERQAQQ